MEDKMIKKCVLFFGVIAVMLILGSAPVQAQTQPIQLALFNPIQIFPENTEISGIRLSLLYGKNTTVTGLDWGLVNHSTAGQSLGVQFGLVGYVEADFKGWQDCGVNIVEGNFEGLQWGLVNYANYAHGLQLGFVNYAGSMKGIQIGLVNIIKQGGMFPFFPIVNWSF
jgi:hypothetical protein